MKEEMKEMTLKTIGFLKAKLTCMKLEGLSSIEKGCNRDCDDCKYCYEQGTIGEQKEALAVAIKALEKQIPMKPLKAYDEQAEQHWLSCPMCYKGLCWEHGFKPKHCSECGQLIDWSE